MHEKLTEAPVRNSTDVAIHPGLTPRQNQDGPVRKRKFGGGMIFLLVLAACVAGVFAWRATHKPATASAQTGRDAAARRPVPVAVATAVTRNLPVYLDGLGTVTAFNTVTVKSRVDGQLAQVLFKEGQDVKEGQLLAVIDTRPFDVALSQAQANFSRDQSQLGDATLNAQRFQQLAQQGVIAQQQSDTQHALVGQLQGSIRADQAQIDSAKLQLTYSHITAPISGRVGLRLVDQGNIVHASDPNGLLVITQMEPISVIFTLPEDTLPAVAKRMHEGTLPVTAMSRDGSTEIAKGTLQTMDNQIDQSTGTIKMKAVFDNKDRALWPNQFVNARLLLDVKKDAITIPAAAVQTGSQGTFVYVVKGDKTVEVRPISIGLTEGNIVAVDKGLTPGEQVVTDGQEGLRSGSVVEPRADARQGGGAGRGNGGGNGGANGGGRPNGGGQGAGQGAAPGGVPGSGQGGGQGGAQGGDRTGAPTGFRGGQGDGQGRRYGGGQAGNGAGGNSEPAPSGGAAAAGDPAASGQGGGGRRYGQQGQGQGQQGQGGPSGQPRAQFVGPGA